MAILVRDGLAADRRRASASPAIADEQKRVIAATVAGIRVVDVYVPNGQAVDSDKYRYKLAWLPALAAMLRAELARNPALAVLGDFNVAPEDRDVHDPALWAGQVLCSEPERAALRDVLAVGLVDSFRLFDQPEKTFSLVGLPAARLPEEPRAAHRPHPAVRARSPRAAPASRIDRNARKGEKPSDHAPVLVELTGSDALGVDPGQTLERAPRLRVP